MSTARAQSVYLVKGDDAALVAQAVRTLLDDVVGDGDHALIVEEIGGGAGDELNVGAVVDAWPDASLPGRPPGDRRA